MENQNRNNSLARKLILGGLAAMLGGFMLIVVGLIVVAALFMV